MDVAHKEQSELKQQLADATVVVSIGAEYRHYKGKDMIYKVTGLGFLEATDELCVIYQAQYGERLTFLRPLSVWLESVEWKGAVVPRFTELNNQKTT